MTESSIPRFFEKDIREKLNIIADFSSLSDNEVKILEDATGGLDFETADKMIENAIGTFALPLGIATNFRINEKDYLIPMVIEEPSVVAAASKAAKIARKHNNANILSITSRFVTLEEAKEIVNVFLGSDFEGGRHFNRINKIPKT